MSITTKLDMVLIYNERLSVINSNYSSLLWSCEVTSQIKYIISALAFDQQPSNIVDL